MADGDSSEQVVNQGVAQADSTPASETQSTEGTPPAAEHAASAENENKTVPYDRFHEVIESRNREREAREQLEGRLRDVETRMSGQASEASDPVVKKLVARGMAEDDARAMVETMREAARAEVRPVQERIRASEVSGWQDSMRRKHKDYDAHLPQMAKAFDSLPPESQSAIMSSPGSLEMFYKAVRADSIESQLSKAKSDGAAEAYKTKSLKTALSSTSGSGVGNVSTKLTRKAIAEMPLEMFAKRKTEIDAWLSSGAKE